MKIFGQAPVNKKTQGHGLSRVPAPCLSRQKLIVLLLGFEVSLRMLAGGAELGSLLGLDDETAVAALPPDLAVALEEIAVREAAQQLQVTALVLGLDGGDHLEGRGDLDEALLLGDFGEFALEDVPLLLLALGCGLQVLGRGADRAGGVAGRDLHVAALEELEETLGVLLLLLRGLGENACDLFVTLLLGLAGEEYVCLLYTSDAADEL